MHIYIHHFTYKALFQNMGVRKIFVIGGGGEKYQASAAKNSSRKKNQYFEKYYLNLPSHAQRRASPPLPFEISGKGSI